jgi:hypothetical protein
MTKICTLQMLEAANRRAIDVLRVCCLATVFRTVAFELCLICLEFNAHLAALIALQFFPKSYFVSSNSFPWHY